MSTTNPGALIAAAKALLAATATSRDAAELFHPHTTNQKFEKSPISGRDGFEIVMRKYRQLYGFMGTGQKESQFMMVVKLGHAPFSTDDNRELWRVADVERIGDIFEAFAWPAGTQTVLFDNDDTVNKDNPNWWLTEVVFKVVYIGDIRT